MLTICTLLTTPLRHALPAGDSRAVLLRGSEAVPLSRDHKPSRADERVSSGAAGEHHRLCRLTNSHGYRMHLLMHLLMPKHHSTGKQGRPEGQA